MCYTEPFVGAMNGPPSCDYVVGIAALFPHHIYTRGMLYVCDHWFSKCVLQGLSYLSDAYILYKCVIPIEPC